MINEDKLKYRKIKVYLLQVFIKLDLKYFYVQVF